MSNYTTHTLKVSLILNHHLKNNLFYLHLNLWKFFKLHIDELLLCHKEVNPTSSQIFSDKVYHLKPVTLHQLIKLKPDSHIGMSVPNESCLHHIMKDINWVYIKLLPHKKNLYYVILIYSLLMYSLYCSSVIGNMRSDL